MTEERVTSAGYSADARATPVAAEQQTRATYLTYLLLWLAALTAIRLAGNLFSNTDLFFDEAQYWFWSQELAFGYYSKPPLIGWIIRGATEICGSSEACIRAPSALFHAGTTLLIYAIGNTLYDARTGFWAGLGYATLPGVSLSSSLISTDVPLLFFVALGILSLVRIWKGGGLRWTLLLGAAIGFGLMSKYAMVYFVMCLGLAILWIRALRPLLFSWRLYAALAIGALIIAPNLIWNLQNGFATFSHTADNANWSGSLLQPLKMLEFLGGQFGVFGPVLFAALLVYCVRWLSGNKLRALEDERARLLLAFSVPVIALMTMQALLSRAHANWAAFAYVAASVLIVAVMLREHRMRLLKLSLAVHLAAALLIPAGGIFAGSFTLPGGADPYARVLGWRDLAAAVEARAEAGGFQAIATDRRSLAAELLYYLRGSRIPVVALRDDGSPKDHFELTRPITVETPPPVLLVSFSVQPARDARLLGSQTIAAGPAKTRTIHFHQLDGELE